MLDLPLTDAQKVGRFMQSIETDFFQKGIFLTIKKSPKKIL
jgi:hypothetical protein